MNSKRYSMLGWLVWQIATRVARRKLTQSRAKLVAAAVVALVVAAGLVAAKAAADDLD